jgi:dipeptidyl aminopeptidase/acylaminoacyl peptidase
MLRSGSIACCTTRRRSSATATQRSPGRSGCPPGSPPLDGYPIMAFGHGNDGSADICANSLPDRMADIWYSDFALEMVKSGYVFAYTDYEGLGTPGPMMFAVCEAMGRSVLDAVRAAHDLLGSAAGDRAVAYGHSLGAFAALGAGEIAPDYAPDANLKAVVALSGGDHIHPERSTPAAPSTIFLQAVAAFSAAFPGLRADDVLTPEAVAELHWIEDTCDLDARFGDTPIADVTHTLPAELPRWVDAINEVNARSARTPVFLAVGGLEDESLADGMRETAALLCETSDKVRFAVYPGANHDSIIADSSIDALTWMTGWMEDRPQPGNCAR